MRRLHFHRAPMEFQRLDLLGGVGGRCCALVIMSLLLGAIGCSSTEGGALNSVGSNDASVDRHADAPFPLSDGSGGSFSILDAPPPVHDPGEPDAFPVADPPAVTCKDEAMDASTVDS